MIHIYHSLKNTKEVQYHPLSFVFCLLSKVLFIGMAYFTGVKHSKSNLHNAIYHYVQILAESYRGPGDVCSQPLQGSKCCPEVHYIKKYLVYF